MKATRFFLLPAFVVMASMAGVAPSSGLAAAGASHANFCAPPAGAQELADPPNVEVWNLPRNAQGEHELILAVHHAGHGADERYCYHYRWNGVVQTVAPTIRVRQGEHFAIRIVNDIAGPSKGERVASTAIPACMPMAMPAPVTHQYVGYLNHTIDDRYMSVPPVDTNLHLHGFEGPESEENIFLSTLSTPMHACEYHVTIPATQPAGTYMYHPHAHGASDAEVALGLAGVWIVEPSIAQLPVADEHVIVLRYRIPVLLDNSFAPDGTPFLVAAIAHEAARRGATPVPYDPFNPPPWPDSYPMNAGGIAGDATGCNGLGSDVLMSVNGSDAPAKLTVPAGVPQLLRIVNGTSDTASELQLRDESGTVQPIRLVGLDGIPVSGDSARPLASYVSTDQVMITSMSRADMLLTLAPGQKVTLSTEHYCMGTDAFFEGHHNLVKIAAATDAGTQTSTLDSAPAVVANTPAGRLVAFARAHPAIIHRRALTFTEYAFPKNGKVPAHQAFYVTETTNPNFREHPYWPTYGPGATVPSNPDIVVKRGSVEEWYLVNATMEAHAFHIHQMAFVQERAVPGVPLMADTVFVPVGKLLPNKRDPNYALVKPRITRILLDFRNVPRGTFVFHCHMLFHEDRGMMAIVRVV
jgi:FtsP/CotA-like multicopper oxidase with cupredoxin domain